MTKEYSFLFILFSIISLSGLSQTDTEFWFVAPDVDEIHGDQPIFLRLSSYNATTLITVSQPANPNGFTPITFTIPVRGTYNLDLTSLINLIENKPPDQILNSGLFIKATHPITAYYGEASYNNSMIFSLLGSNALGREFIIPGQNVFNNINGSGAPNSHNSFDIIAAEDNTVITIIPSNDIVGHANHVPFTIILNKGQTYTAVATNRAAAYHLFGSRVSANKPIAITIKDDGLLAPPGSCADIIADQIFPINITGNDYIIVRGYLNSSVDDWVFILATQDGTMIYKNGSLVPFATIQSGETTSISIPTTQNIVYLHSNKPIYTLHLTGYTCELGSSIVPPITCTGSTEISFSRTTSFNFGMILFTKDVFTIKVRHEREAANMAHIENNVLLKG